jgi:SpoVK/Ycf46/Vps4 family AAA+-type ATPase
MSGRVILDQEWVTKLITGTETIPKFSPDFPAKNITTAMTWDDLVLNNYTQNQLNEIMIWVQHNDTLMQDEVLKRKIKPGYRALFHGPSGTGKTLTATLLGRHLNKEIYRIDLSQVVSKYIGETEKNLEKVFIKAENKNWILFFDEADALFGKRTNVQNSHDRYANQEVSYLLQRIEDYPGLLILASNLKSNMDDAFLRRFHTIIHFSIPNSLERLRLWEKAFPASYKPEPDINLRELADKYEINGAAILNIIHYAALQSISRNDQYIRKDDLVEAIRKEYRKEERTMS